VSSTDKRSLGVHGSKTEAKRTRPIIVVPKDGGELREVSHEDVITGLVKKTAVEIAGSKDYIACELCGKPRKRHKTGPTPRYCAPCALAAKQACTRQWYAKNPEAARQASRKRYAEKPENAKRWRTENPEAAREASRKWRAENPEAVREANRQYYAKKKAEREAAKKAAQEQAE
jgi:hypothetical protein